MTDPEVAEVNPAALLGALEECEEIVASVDQVIGNVTDPDHLWAILEQVRSLRGRDFLASLEDSIVLALHTALDGHRHTLADGRTIYPTVTRQSEKWDGPALISQVAARTADDVVKVDPETGEVEVPPVGHIVEHACRTMAECLGGLAPSTKWRTTPLQGMGIRPSRYRTYEPGRPKVEVERS